ncbi:hypothetical protein B0H63DRAFT_220495 [Podospora didyma]|uniref:GMC oxidoreductase n=1 Tax=Podospora didyma TaxID=330526 RepID=A0AAE0NBF8_9PEZI|nr:hypothetical protein B0H63DRAFT_220495 [Podospora didyma]
MTILWSRLVLWGVFTLTFTRTNCTTRRRRLASSAYPIPGFNATYDYIVIGGGTAGLPVAARLAESGASVAVVEAGGFYEVDNGNYSIIPWYAVTMPLLSDAPDYARQPLMDWDLLTVPQVSARGQTAHYPAGKTLGGSSAHNTLAYIRIPKGTHQRWADGVGDEVYEWENMLRYYRRSCTLHAPDWGKRKMPNASFEFDGSICDSDPKGKGGRGEGPIQVSWSNWVDPATTWLARGIQSVIPMSKEGFNSGKTEGTSAWSSCTVNPKWAERSSATEYLKGAIEDTEIMVYHHTQALRIGFDGGKKADSVRVSTQGLEYTLTAGKEVILSAGVFHSPQLLMVSGIGPKSVLSSHGIPVIADLPGVGQGMQDQVVSQVSWGLGTIPTTSGLIRNPANREKILRQYLDHGEGPLTFAAGGYISFEKVPSSLRAGLSQRTRDLLDTALSPDWPEVEYIGNAVVNFTTGETTGIIGIILLHPFSRGKVTISSANISDPPVIDPGWLTDPADGEILITAIKRARQFWNTSALTSVKTGPELQPGAQVVSDADLLRYIKNACTTIWHASGTCRMGKNSSDGAVVDSKGRVFGVSGLRVVDASVLPFALPTHPTSVIYALAEKIAEDIILGR